jgi:hypothetical protein
MTIEKAATHNPSVGADAGQPISINTNQGVSHRVLLKDVPYGSHLLDTKCTFIGRQICKI